MSEAMYFMIEAMAGLDPDHPRMVESQAIPLSQFASTAYHYLRHHVGAFLIVREISLDEYLEWVSKKYGYEGRKYGRKGQGQGDGGA